MTTLATTALEQYISEQTAARGSVSFDEIIFANIPNLTANTLRNHLAMPASNHIVHRQAISQTGVINDNAVVYSVTMGTEIGDFDFNFIGLVNRSRNLLAVAVYTDTIRKVKNKNGIQGNSITRSILLEFTGAKSLTNINVNANTWQIDFTVRLKGIDEKIRLTNRDLYGRAVFFNEGFKVTRGSGNQYFIEVGNGYIEGIRADNKTRQSLTVRNLPCSIYLDIVHHNTVTGAYQTENTFLQASKNDWIDSSNHQHYVQILADIDRNGEVTDRRIAPKWQITETTADANTLTTDGIYAYTTAVEGKNLPSNHSYHLFVMGGGNAGWCRQIAKKVYGLETYERTKTSYNGGWGAWKRTDTLGLFSYIQNVNLNDYKQGGFYFVGYGENRPVAHSGMLQVFAVSGGNGVQQIYTLFNKTDTYQRWFDNSNNTWGEWKRIDAADWPDVRNRPRTLDGYATTMNGQFTLNHLAALVKGQRNSVDSWFVGMINEISSVVALYSYTYDTGIKLFSDRVESNKPLYVNGSPVFTEATLTPARDTNLTAFIPGTQIKYQDATPAQLPVGTHMGFSQNARLTNNGVYSGWGMVSKPNNSATSAVRFGINGGQFYFQQASNENDWLPPVKVETEKHTEVDLSTLDPNIWYPVVITGISPYAQEKIRVSHNLFVAGNAEWGNYGSHKGFSLLCEWRVNSNNWGVMPHSITVHSFAYDRIKDSKSPLLKIGQLTNSGSNYCLLRGGTKYDVLTPAHCNVSVKSSNYTIYDQSVNLLTLAEYDDRLKPVTIFNELKNIANAKKSPATTLAGYGITDGVNKDGDTMTGNLTLPKVSLTANKIQFLDDFIYKNNSGNHLHGFHFTDDSGEPDNNSRGNASLYAKKFEATHIGNGAYANQYTSKAPFMVEENDSLPRDAYHPFVKGKVRTNNQWGAAFSFGYTTNQDLHGDGFGKGIIHLAEDNGRNLAWTFEHDGTMTGGDFRAQGKSLSQAVMHNEITYQKVGDFEIRKYPDGTMIQTYRFNPPNSRVGSQSNKFSFNWALAFTEKPKIWIQHIDLETGDHHGSIDMDMIIKWNETTNGKVTFWAWEWVFNNNQTNFDFLAIGRWK